MTPHSNDFPTRRRLAALLIAALAILPYLNSLGGEFVFDDLPVIRDNSLIHDEPVTRLFTQPYYEYLYRPITLLTYVANDRLDARPLGYHVCNVALHTAASLAVLAVGILLLRSTPTATAAAALFATHPIHTEAVSNIVGRAELLAALFGLAALLAFSRAVRERGRTAAAWHALAAAAFAVALLSKESAVAVAVLLPLLHWRVRPEDTLPRRIAVLLPAAVLGTAYLGVRWLVVGSVGIPRSPILLDNPLAHVDVWTRLRTGVVVLWEYVSQLALPRYLSADYSYDAIPVVTSATDPRLLLAASALLLVGLGLTAAARRSMDAATAAAFFVVPLALTANILFPIGTIKAERLLYLPSVGWCLLVASLAQEAFRSRPRLHVAVLVALTLGYSARTVVRNRDWTDNRALFESAVAVEPRSAKAHYNLGVAYELQGRLDEARVQYRRTLAIYPWYAEAAFNIANVYVRRGIDAGAVHWFEEALALNWQMATAHLNLGLLRQQWGDLDAAEAAFLGGLEVEPENPLLLVNLAGVRVAKGDVWGAWEVTDRAAGLGSPHEPEVVALVAAADNLIRRVAQP